MTPDEYLKRLGCLIDEGLDRESLDFAAQFEPTVCPPLTAEQSDFVGGMLEGSAMAVAMPEVTPCEEPGPDGEIRPPITPEAYLGELGQLVGAGRHEDALDFLLGHQSSVQPKLSLEQRDLVDGYLEGAAKALARLDAQAVPAGVDSGR